MKVCLTKSIRAIVSRKEPQEDWRVDLVLKDTWYERLLSSNPPKPMKS